MEYKYSDGGRVSAGFKGTTGDCGTRAIAIATGKPYKEVYQMIFDAQGKSPRNGTDRKVMRKLMESLGWEWIPTMKIGQGCKVHLKADELPSGRLIVSLSRHFCAVIDHVIYDNHDPRRGGTRCVYGYWKKDERNKAKQT